MTGHRISGTTITALLVSTTAALFARTIVQRHLVNIGYETAYAADLAYLAVPPILATLLFPIWRTQKTYILAQFRRVDFSWKLAVKAIAIGVLLRIAWWSQLIAGISFGFYRAPEPVSTTPLSVSFQCPPPEVIGLGFFVMAMCVPLIEEIVHRGYVQGILHRRGLAISVLVSAIVFTIFHRYSSWTFVFVAGIVFGSQYWICQSLWPSLITHATVNTLVQIDWRCMTGQWNPESGAVPVIGPGIIASCSVLASAIAVFLLIRGMAIRARIAP